MTPRYKYKNFIMAGYKQKGDGDEDPVLLLFKAFFFPFCLWPFYSLRARAGLLCRCPQGRRRTGVFMAILRAGKEAIFCLSTRYAQPACLSLRRNGKERTGHHTRKGQDTRVSGVPNRAPHNYNFF